ncbi:hypothetical protein BDC45DRAFT_536489 [Circinella umbellata]|nr:hypothetical protein BDC45DRAFT_536489 [Circinella umbellata]
MIISPNNSIYKQKFTEKDLKEICDFKAVEFDVPLPAELNEYLYSFKKMKTAKELNEAVLKIKKLSIQESRQTNIGQDKLLKAHLGLYNYNILSDDFIEDSIEYRIWFFVAKSFCGKKKSLAPSKRHNQNQALAATKSGARKVTGCQPDMTCVYLNHELALSEVGLADDGENGTKEFHKNGLKTPKMLKEYSL